MTIKDLARETGYSVGTISRVLNHHPNVSEKTRQEVLAAIERFGFERNENAKNLKQRRRDGILVLVKGRRNELFARIIEQLQQVFANSRFALVTEYFNETENEVHHAVRLCGEKKPEGILFLGGNRVNFEAEFGNIHVPSVLLTDDASGLPFANLSSVCTDDRAAARCAVRYLISKGHRRIAVIGGDPTISDTSRMRLEGCVDALEESRIPGPVGVEQGLYSYEDGYSGAKRMVRAGLEFTAIFAMSDVQAIGSIRALKEAGLRVPEDVSVCGFDGLDISKYILPQLTTVSQSAELLAQRSAQLLLQQIDRKSAGRHEVVPFRLLEGESVAAI